jgi:hypothetical protein
MQRSVALLIPNSRRFAASTVSALGATARTAALGLSRPPTEGDLPFDFDATDEHAMDSHALPRGCNASQKRL